MILLFFKINGKVGRFIVKKINIEAPGLIQNGSGLVDEEEVYRNVRRMPPGSKQTVIPSIKH
ncbi:MULTISPECIES: hypothetical protein [unclassified Bacillus (in: firmicutes)]|uniref:hypothetical protein n=1 Tax=unclassified Bacillus (in: firmicutes) TaxID=185979 RepID=UPI002FFEF09E